MAEKEYIERSALLAEYDRVHVGPPGGARKLIEEIPAADVVEVVRCKDCVYNDNASCMCAEDNDPNYDPEYFCAHGERKERQT